MRMPPLEATRHRPVRPCSRRDNLRSVCDSATFVAGPIGSAVCAGTILGYNTGFTFFSKADDDDESDEAWMSYKVKFSPGFDWTEGGKLPGLCGGGARPHAGGAEEHPECHNCACVRPSRPSCRFGGATRATTARACEPDDPTASECGGRSR